MFRVISCDEEEVSKCLFWLLVGVELCYCKVEFVIYEVELYVNVIVRGIVVKILYYYYYYCYDK